MDRLRIQIVSRHPDQLAQVLQQHDTIRVVDSEPDVIAAYGGDGSLLHAERHFPGVPKFLVRSSQICADHFSQSLVEIPQLLAEGTYTVAGYNKLRATVRGEERLAVNDVIIGHERINTGLRARFQIDDGPAHDIVGDGIVCATPLGATAYYYSITRQVFSAGIGIAVNNPMNTQPHIVVEDNSVITIEVLRGPGVLAVDNNHDYISLTEGDVITVTVAPEQIQLIEFPDEQACYNTYHPTTRAAFGHCQIGKEEL